MKIINEHIRLANEVLTLTNQRAIFWENQNTLILSDIHIGKTAHFRKHGIPMPDDILQKDLERLGQLILHFNPNRILVVGDLFHAEMNRDMKTFKDWLSLFPDLGWVLVKGNHDRLSKRIMDDLNIEVIKELVIGPFIFVHDNLERSHELVAISGHTHPGVLIKGKGRQKLKLPCYQITSKQLVLPAFSLFTGLNIRAVPEDAVCYAFTESSMFKF